MSKKSIFRVAKTRDNPYAMIDKGFLNHPQLSYRAKGILAYILSKPDHWTIQIHDLLKHGKEGRDAIYAGIKELTTHGFIHRVSCRESGKITGYKYIVYEHPHLALSEHRTDTLLVPTPEKVPCASCVDLSTSHLKMEQTLGTPQPTAPLPGKPPVTHKNQETTQTVDTPHPTLLPENPDPGNLDSEIQDPENPTQVSNDLL